MSDSRDPHGPDSDGPADHHADAHATGDRLGAGPGSVPPWQRVGTAPVTTPGPELHPSGESSEPVDRGVSDQPRSVGNTARQDTRPAEAPSADLAVPEPKAPPRPLVTGTAAKKYVNSGAGVNNSAAPRDSAIENERGRNSPTGRVVDGPTRNIGRSAVDDDLPDLDSIHHPPAEMESVPHAAPTQAAAAARGPLRAAVQVRRIDPWSTFKVSAVLSIVLFFIWMIAVAVLYLILDGVGVWDSINDSFGTLASGGSEADSAYEVTAGDVFGIAAAIGALYVVVFTALTTVGSLIYNMCADLVGGIEITLADRD